MPCHNGAKYLAEAVESVQKQTYVDWELIVINDGSSDGSSQLADSLAETDNRIHVIHHKKPSGRSSLARNSGLKKAKGRYIAFLDCDDKWHSEKLEKQLSAMLESAANISCTNYRTINAQSETIGRVVCWRQQIHKNVLFRGNPIGMLTGMHDREVLGEHLLPENLKYSEDWAFWMKLIAHPNAKAICVSELLAEYRVHQASKTAKKSNMLSKRWKIYREHLGWPAWKASFGFACYFINGLFKTFTARYWR